MDSETLAADMAALRLNKPMSSHQSTTVEDVVLSLSQHKKVVAACAREEANAVKKCLQETSWRKAAFKTGGALLGTVISGNPVNPMAVAGGMAGSVVSEMVDSNGCARAASAIANNDCMKRVMPNGYINIATDLRRSGNRG